MSDPDNKTTGIDNKSLKDSPQEASPTLLKRCLPLWLYVAGICILAVILFLNIRGNAYRFSFTVHCMNIVGTLLWIGLLYRAYFQKATSPNKQNFCIHPAWIIVILAIGLRILSLTQMPFHDQTGFEEQQTGWEVHKIFTIVTGMEFRFTNTLAASGFYLLGEYSLFALRLPFMIFGCLGLIIMVGALRRMNIGWIPTLFVILIMATLHWLAIVSGIAEETCCHVTWVCLIVYFLVRLEQSEHFEPVWSGLIGMACGVLMYEYVSWRILIALSTVWLAHLVIRRYLQTKVGFLKESLWLAFPFILALVILSVPVLLDIIYNPGNNVFFEMFRRHSANRTSGLLSPHAATNITHYARALTGLPAINGTTYLILQKGPYILREIGLLFALAFAVALLYPWRPLLRWMALLSLIAILGMGATASNSETVRLTPILALLLFMLAGMVHQILCLISYLSTRWSSVRTQSIIIGLISITVLAYAGYLSKRNLQITFQMARDPAVAADWATDDYAFCLFINQAARPGQRVHVVIPDQSIGITADPSWVFLKKNLEVIPLAELPPAERLQPGDLVIIGNKSRVLDQGEWDNLLTMARQYNCLATLKTGRSITGVTIAASIEISEVAP